MQKQHRPARIEPNSKQQTLKQADEQIIITTIIIRVLANKCKQRNSGKQSTFVMCLSLNLLILGPIKAYI